jgi:hypothetical protein
MLEGSAQLVALHEKNQKPNSKNVFFTFFTLQISKEMDVGCVLNECFIPSYVFFMAWSVAAM